jgi:hypothetical protein
MSTMIPPILTMVRNRLTIPTCAGCGAMQHPGTCETGCREQHLDLVRAAAYDELVAVRRGARACTDAFRAVVEEFACLQPAAGQYESTYRSVQHQARTVLHRFPDPPLQEQVLRGPTEPATTSWCAECGGIDAPQQCLEFCIWRSVEWVTHTSYQQERMLAVSEWLIESRLRELLRRIASVTPLDGEWPRSWRALQAEARGLLEASNEAAPIAVSEDGGACGEVATSGTAATAGGLNATVDGHEAEAFQRGRREGMAWARDYATAEELRKLVENFESGRGGGFDMDSQHWRGFIDGAEEVMDTVGPQPNG